MSTKLKALTEKLINLEGEICQEIGRLYPPGSKIEFYIMSSQKVPSTGIVGNAKANIFGGYVSVRHLEAKPKSRYLYRQVAVSSIISTSVESRPAALIVNS